MPSRIVVDHLVEELLEAEAALVDAVTEAITYRHLLCAALDQLQAMSRRARGAEQRIRQLSDLEAWHDDICE